MNISASLCILVRKTGGIQFYFIFPETDRNFFHTSRTRPKAGAIRSQKNRFPLRKAAVSNMKRELLFFIQVQFKCIATQANTHCFQGYNFVRGNIAQVHITTEQLEKV